MPRKAEAGKAEANKTEAGIEDAQTYAIIGAAQSVHREPGAGFLEAIYQEALAIEFGNVDLPFFSESELIVTYKDTQLKSKYRVDFICFGDVVVAIKVLSGIGNNEQAQLINYLKATGFTKGLILNFGSRSLQVKRIAN